MTNQLLPFQPAGVEFLLGKLPKSKAPHRLLADDMGLGKTIQVCEAIRRLKEKHVQVPLLIVCPPLIKMTWKQTLINWSGISAKDIQIITYGAQKVTGSVVIVNYELLHNKALRVQLLNRKFLVGVFDEVHRLKSLDSKISEIVLGNTAHYKPLIGQCYYKWCLSGTFIPNRPAEAYLLLKTLAPECIEPYLSWDAFAKYFCGGYYDECTGKTVGKGGSHLDELKERMAGFMLRRTEDEVNLPDKLIQHVYCQVSMPQVQNLAKEISVMSTENTHLATLRKAVGIAKIPFCIDYLTDWLENHPEQKIVVFAYSRQVIESIADSDKLAKFNPVYVYGGSSAKDKEFALRYFAEDPACRMLELQILSGGEALDGLQYTANNVFFAEQEWSAGVFDQALKRIHRIGQTKAVHAMVAIAQNVDLENIITQTYKRKKKTIQKLLDPCNNKTDILHTPSINRGNHMTIEDKLDAIIQLLEVIAANTQVGSRSTEAEDSEPAPKPTRGRKPAAKSEVEKPSLKKSQSAPQLDEEQVREKMLEVYQAHVEQYPGPKAKLEAKAALKRIVKQTGYDSFEEMEPSDYREFVNGLERLKGTFVPDAEESDDLEDI
jgi:SNF2 family DNA or RNA helicase